MRSPRLRHLSLRGIAGWGCRLFQFWITSRELLCCRTLRGGESSSPHSDSGRRSQVTNSFVLFPPGINVAGDNEMVTKKN